MKGQVGMEFLFIMGFTLLMIIPVLLIFLNESDYLSQDITSVQANKLAEELQEAANTVYYLGEPSKKTISMYIPQHVQNITFYENQIRVLVDTGDNSYVVTKFVSTNVSGTLNPFPGMHEIEIYAKDETIQIEG